MNYKDKTISVKIKKEVLEKVEPQMKKKGAKFVPLVNQVLLDWAEREVMIEALLSEPENAKKLKEMEDNQNKHTSI